MTLEYSVSAKQFPVQFNFVTRNLFSSEFQEYLKINSQAKLNSATMFPLGLCPPHNHHHHLIHGLLQPLESRLLLDKGQQAEGILLSGICISPACQDQLRQLCWTLEFWPNLYLTLASTTPYFVLLRRLLASCLVIIYNYSLIIKVHPTEPRKGRDCWRVDEDDGRIYIFQGSYFVSL